MIGLDFFFFFLQIPPLLLLSGIIYNGRKTRYLLKNKTRRGGPRIALIHCLLHITYLYLYILLREEEIERSPPLSAAAAGLNQVALELGEKGKLVPSPLSLLFSPYFFFK